MALATVPKYRKLVSTKHVYWGSSNKKKQRTPIKIIGHSYKAPSLYSLQIQALMGTGGFARAVRALRLLLPLVLALTAVQYLFGSILNSSTLRTYLYAPMHNATTTTTSEKMQTWLKNLLKSVTIDNSNKTTSSTSSTSSTHTSSADKQSFTLNMTRNNISVDVTKIVEVIKNPVTTEEHIRNKLSMPLCAEMPPDLGPIPVNKTEIDLDWVEKCYPEVRSGGLYSSPNCTARHRVAIIVPFRDRQQHLAIFLNHMHPFLMKQQLEYGIYTVEQTGVSEFNRAKLMNVGFVESQKQRSWQCFIFHDIDLLPLDSRNLYSCPRQPRHMSASIDKFKFRLPYNEIFGGVSAMTQDQFSKVNGFSNKYWGWGGEDDDMFYRLKNVKYHVARYQMSIARYTMLDHKKSIPNPKRYKLLSQTSKTFQKDGLSTLEYELVKVTPHHLYTHILVNIDKPRQRTYLAKLLFGDK